MLVQKKFGSVVVVDGGGVESDFSVLLSKKALGFAQAQAEQ